tara:strand:+ start:85 stop:453 length:369 start_codon:yes stop_codon:yes gene_type:complete
MKTINVTSFKTFVHTPFILFDGERYMADLYINVDQISHFKRGNKETNNFRPTRIIMLNGSQFEVAESPLGIERLLEGSRGASIHLCKEDYIQPTRGGYVQQDHSVICPDGKERCLDGFLAEW